MSPGQLLPLASNAYDIMLTVMENSGTDTVTKTLEQPPETVKVQVLSGQPAAPQEEVVDPDIQFKLPTTEPETESGTAGSPAVFDAPQPAPAATPEVPAPAPSVSVVPTETLSPPAQVVPLEMPQQSPASSRPATASKTTVAMTIVAILIVLGLTVLAILAYINSRQIPNI
jgi:hypothetical protein